MIESLNLRRETGISMLLVEQEVHNSLAVSGYKYDLTQEKEALQGPSRELAKGDQIWQTYLGL